jgi:DNA-binding response OmpR family regulator
MSRKLLVVDDDKAIRWILQATFESLGYEVLTAGDGEEGEQVARDAHPGLVILDIMMPRKNGYTVCVQLKRDPATAKIPIVLLTAKSLREDGYWGYECGADAFMTKPYEPKELETLVDRLFREAEEGKRSVAWTGLPSASKVREESEVRREAGSDVVLVKLCFPDEPRRVFLQKYGQTKYRDLIHTVAWKLYEVIREEAFEGMAGHAPDDSFLLLIHRSEAAKIEQVVLALTAESIGGFYEARERAEKAVIFWRHGQGRETVGLPVKVPLLSLQWSVEDPSAM